MKFFVVPLLLIIAIAQVQAQSFNEQDLFKKAFKKKSSNYVLLPVFFETSVVGEALFKIENSSELLNVEKQQLIKLLGSELNESILEKLKLEKKKVSTTKLQQFGISLVLDERSLIVIASIAAENRNLNTQDIAFNRVPKWARKARLSQGLSGFVNTFNYYRRDTSTDSESLTSDQNFNFSIGKLAFLAQTSWQRDDGESDYFRQDLRFTYDDPKRLVRYQLGDLTYNVNQFQSYQPGLGFLVSTNFNLDPYRLFNPMTFREVTLNTASRVRVFVNGVLVQTLNLPAGRHRLENLPLNEGINNIRLEIQDNRGRQENIQFKGTTSYNLIGSGVHDFTYGGGIPAKSQFGDRMYDRDGKKYFGILNHLYGLSSQTNIGFGVNFNSKQRLGSAYFLKQSLIGFTNFNLSYSELLRPESGEEGSGLGARLTHTFRDYGQGSSRQLRTFDIALEYLGPQFSSMDDLSLDDSSSLNSELGYTQFVSDNFNYRLRGTYKSFSRGASENSFTGSLGLTYLWKRNYQVTGQYSHSQFQNGTDDNQVLFSFTFTAPEKGQAFSTSYNTTRDEFNAGANYAGRGRPSNYRAQANVRKSNTESQYEAEVGQQTQWYVGSLNWLERNPDDSESSRLQTVNFNSALAYAGGAFAVTRPINQSFALVTTGEALSGHDLYLNRNDDQYEARTSLLDGAVLPAYQAYRYYPIRIDGSELPVGVKSPPQEVVVGAPFRGGVRVHFSHPITFAFVGKVKWKGRPLDLKTGELISTKDELDIYPFFTNRRGRFLVESVPPGKYQVKVEGKLIDEVTVSKPKNGFFKWEKNYE